MEKLPKQLNNNIIFYRGKDGEIIIKLIRIKKDKKI